ncbi:MAG: hypothetical protein Q7S56_02235 [Nanoarchaeota archaeon]|nr:hypothetical protein [Nanoarchaeota archaeon]
MPAPFSPEQNAYALELYSLSSNSISLAIEMFYEKYHIKLASSIMKRKWGDAGYKPNSHGGDRARNAVHHSPCWGVSMRKSNKKYLEERCRVGLR